MPPNKAEGPKDDTNRDEVNQNNSTNSTADADETDNSPPPEPDQPLNVANVQPPSPPVAPGPAALPLPQPAPVLHPAAPALWDSIEELAQEWIATLMLVLNYFGIVIVEHVPGQGLGRRRRALGNIAAANAANGQNGVPVPGRDGLEPVDDLDNEMVIINGEEEVDDSDGADDDDDEDDDFMVEPDENADPNENGFEQIVLAELELDNITDSLNRIIGNSRARLSLGAIARILLPTLRFLMNKQVFWFLILILSKIMYDYWRRAFCFALITIPFQLFNPYLVREAKKREANLELMLFLALKVGFFIYAPLFVLSEHEIYKPLFFSFSNPELSTDTMGNVLWINLITAQLVKLGTILVKIVVVVWPSSTSSPREGGAHDSLASRFPLSFEKKMIVYTFIEETSQLYQSILPIGPWVLFFSETQARYPDSSFTIFPWVFASYYLIVKLSVSGNVISWLASARKLFQSTHYGRTPTAAELANCGSVECPICFDQLKAPIRLSCSHIYCTNCISTWFEEKSSCPTCRQVVTDGAELRNGSTDGFVHLF